jgi:hypothetical protein
MNDEKTAVYLDYSEAELFKKFCQYREQIEAILDADIFSIKWGKAVLNFDGKSNLISIKKEIDCYKRKKLDRTFGKAV